MFDLSVLFPSSQMPMHNFPTHKKEKSAACFGFTLPKILMMCLPFLHLSSNSIKLHTHTNASASLSRLLKIVSEIIISFTHFAAKLHLMPTIEIFSTPLYLSNIHSHTTNTFAHKSHTSFSINLNPILKMFTSQIMSKLLCDIACRHKTDSHQPNVKERKSNREKKKCDFFVNSSVFLLLLFCCWTAAVGVAAIWN